MEWMLDIQLGRRNLSPIQRIAITEKYRPIYEKQAKENQSGKEYGNGGTKLTENLPQALDNVKKERNPTTDKRLSDMAGVSEKTYRMGAKILNSDNEDLKQRVLSGETAISTGYKELIGKKENEKVEDNNVTTSSTQPTLTPPTPQKPQISEEVRQICEDLKTNIRQRGDVGGSAKKVGLRIKELERLYGIQNGSIYFQGNQHKEVVTNKSDAPTFTQEQLASRMGMSVDTLQNYKLLAEMIPELD